MTSQADVTAPAVDIYENDTEFLLVADMPGVAKEALTVEVERGELRIAGTNGVHYERRFRLPRGVTGEEARASLENGVLTLHVPKPPSEQPRRIPIAMG